MGPGRCCWSHGRIGIELLKQCLLDRVSLSSKISDIEGFSRTMLFWRVVGGGIKLESIPILVWQNCRWSSILSNCCRRLILFEIVIARVSDPSRRVEA